ncbi:hypothetical protein TB1_042668 [Malus domestica]
MIPESGEGQGISLLCTTRGGDLPKPSPKPCCNQDRRVKRKIYKSKEDKVNLPDLSSEPWKQVEGELLPLIAGGDCHSLLREERQCSNLQQRPTNSRSGDQSQKLTYEEEKQKV